jgi:AmiR/NasT family two-component response regulator
MDDDQAPRRPVYYRLDLTAEEFAAHKALVAELDAARARLAELEAVRRAGEMYRQEEVQLNETAAETAWAALNDALDAAAAAETGSGEA